MGKIKECVGCVSFSFIALLAAVIGLGLGLGLRVDVPELNLGLDPTESERNCTNVSGKFLVHGNTTKNCNQIGRKNSEWCYSNENVIQNCGETCGLLDGACGACLDSEESFFVWGELELKTCEQASFRPDEWCPKSVFRQNCPVTCDSCPLEPFVYDQCPKNAACCNGLGSNCNLPMNEFLFATVHNAMHDDFPFPNNEAPLEEALEAGYRGLQLDLCLCGTDLIFCHGNCNVGKREVAEVFENINDFLTLNPTEVVVINVELSVGDPTPLQLWELIKDINGMKKRVYVHDGSDNWPTLGSMIQSEEQLVIFQHDGPYCHNFDVNNNVDGCHERIIDFFQYTVETEFDFDSISEIDDSETSCIGTRGWNISKGFYSVNNFVTQTTGPSKKSSNELNSREFLEARIADCEEVGKLKANFINIDFWQKGDLLRVAHDQNKERANLERTGDNTETALIIPREKGIYLG